MLHEFLEINRAELIERCQAKVASRAAPHSPPRAVLEGIPAFLAQLAESLRQEGRQSGMDMTSEISESATRHGDELLRQGFTVDQVIHDYGDVCQAVTELAGERGDAVTVEEFHTLNRCLDNAIADAVTEYDRQRDRQMRATGDLAMSERLGSLAHELRNALNPALMAFAALKSGRVGITGTTSGVLERSLASLGRLIDSALADVRMSSGLPTQIESFAVDRFIAEMQATADLSARSKACTLAVHPVQPGLAVRADKQLLNSALSNLLQNAFKFTRPHTQVALKSYGTADRVLIEVQDQCGGLCPGGAATMFTPFDQQGTDRSGLGLGLSISRRAVEACSGTLAVRDLPGIGCVFTIDLPRDAVEPALA
jgi:signal transduction histidine kinase